MRKFAQKYEKQLQLLEQKKKKARENWYHNLGGGLPYKHKLPYNKKCKEILEREKLEKLEKDNKNILMKEKARKMNSYAKMVKEIHWPSVSS